MFVYKIDVLETLKENGYNTNRLRKEKILSEATIQQIRENKVVGINSLDKICTVLDMQIGNIIKHVHD